MTRSYSQEEAGGMSPSMVAQCTPDDLRLRFMGPIESLPHQTAARFSQIDYDREMALVAVAEGGAYGSGPIFGVVRLVADPENEVAEYAVLVRSGMKGKGLGYSLMSAILDYARGRGLRCVHGEILRENATMLQMARELGFRIELEQGSGTARVVVSLVPDGTRPPAARGLVS